MATKRHKPEEIDGSGNEFIFHKSIYMVGIPDVPKQVI